MSFLAGLLPAIGGLLPGIISTVGKVVGRLGSGDFSGAIGEVGKALSGGGAGEAVKEAAAGAGEALRAERERMEKQAVAESEAKQKAFDREIANKRKLMELEYEVASRARQQDHSRRLNSMLPIWRGRGPARYARAESARAPEDQVSSGRPIEPEYEEEYEDELPPIIKSRKARGRAGYKKRNRY